MGTRAPYDHGRYSQALRLLTRSEVSFLVGGAYALALYTGIERQTKDLDLFLRPDDCTRALELLETQGWKCELTYPHWLGKARRDDACIDLIFSSGNGLVNVDDDWFTHARRGQVLGESVLMCPPEEMIWSRAFIMERERFDGADVLHLLRACADEIQWPRLVLRFGEHWRVLFAHLVLFGYVYPIERTRIPAWIVEDGASFLVDEATQASRDAVRTPLMPGEALVCRGTLLSRAQYLVDVERWGYGDARLPPEGGMSLQEIAHWTSAIQRDGDPNALQQ